MDPLKAPPPQETKLHFLDYWRIIRIRKTVILAVFLLVVITATVVTLSLTPSYRSTARIKVERDQSDIAGMTGPQMVGLQYDPYFIQTEYEVIQSELILERIFSPTNLIASDTDASQKVTLDELWAKRLGAKSLTKQEKLNYLRRHLDVRPTRNTSLIEISYESERPDEAAFVANRIAEVYRDYRVNERVRLTSGGIDALTNRIAEVERQVRNAQSNVEYLRVKLEIPDMVAQENTPSVLMTAETLRRIESIRIETQAALVNQEELLNKLKGYKPEDLAQVIPTCGIPDTLLNDLLGQLTLSEQRLVSLNKQLGPENSDVKAATALVADLKTKIQKRVAGFLLGLEAKVAATERSLTSISNEVDRARQLDIENATKTRPYWEAKNNVDELKRLRQALYFKIASEETDLKLPKTSMVEIVESAVPSLRPSRPNKPLNIALGVIIGLVVGVGLAFFIEYLDTSVKTIDDVERSLGSPVLGVIPQNVGVLLDEGAESPHAEAYRVLRTNLLFSRKDDKLNSIAIVSAGAGEGKSTTVFNLATVFAQSGQRILIVDSDLRRPTLHKMLRVTNTIGLTNYLLKQNTLEAVIQTTPLPTLDFMASGKLPSSSLGILSSGQMRDLITELKQHYDFVFFDSPPVMGVSDASILASEVDMTLQVIQYRRYPQPMNIRAKQLIEKVGGNLVGIVLNNINMSQDESYYYYSGYYHDYYSKNEDQEPAPSADPSSGGKTA